jgi:hypothetical protein
MILELFLMMMSPAQMLTLRMIMMMVKRQLVYPQPKIYGEAKPSQLGYYSGSWVHMFIYAKNSYRKIIHTSDLFPECNTESLRWHMISS